MNLLGQFLLNNLLPALVAGSLAWAFVHLAVNLLGIRHGKQRLCLYLAPVVKSTLVLLGLTVVLMWPPELFRAWYARALPPGVVLPAFAVLTGLALLARQALTQRARRRLLAGTEPVAADGRLGMAMDAVMRSYADNSRCITARCQLETLPPRPRLLQRRSGLRSPAVVTTGEPAIVFPAGLLPQLSDQELQGALAHEVAHLVVRQPFSCTSPESIRLLSSLNPFAGVMAAQLHREEEKACDDVAVDILGDADGYAGMLMKSYRYASSRAHGLGGKLQFVPQLLGVRPMLSERVEHLMDRDAIPGGLRQRLGFILAWILLIAVFFTA